MYLNRKIDSTLVEWKNDPRHKPLLMRGARQVGKTTAVRRLAESFETFVVGVYRLVDSQASLRLHRLGIHV